MNVQSLQSLLEQLERTGRSYLEFLRVDSMSMGIYRLHPGEADKQQPHGEDEVYFVLSGRASFVQGGTSRTVQSGDILFVEKHLPHHFTDICETLVLLVYFAPAEGSLK